MEKEISKIKAATAIFNEARKQKLISVMQQFDKNISKKIETDGLPKTIYCSTKIFSFFESLKWFDYNYVESENIDENEIIFSWIEDIDLENPILPIRFHDQKPTPFNILLNGFNPINVI